MTVYDGLVMLKQGPQRVHLMTQYTFFYVKTVLTLFMFGDPKTDFTVLNIWCSIKFIYAVLET